MYIYIYIHVYIYININIFFISFFVYMCNKYLYTFLFMTGGIFGRHSCGTLLRSPWRKPLRTPLRLYEHLNTCDVGPAA